MMMMAKSCKLKKAIALIIALMMVLLYCFHSLAEGNPLDALPRDEGRDPESMSDYGDGGSETPVSSGNPLENLSSGNGSETPSSSGNPLENLSSGNGSETPAVNVNPLENLSSGNETQPATSNNTNEAQAVDPGRDPEPSSGGQNESQSVEASNNTNEAQAVDPGRDPEPSSGGQNESQSVESSNNTNEAQALDPGRDPEPSSGGQNESQSVESSNNTNEAQAVDPGRDPEPSSSGQNESQSVESSNSTNEAQATDPGRDPEPSSSNQNESQPAASENNTQGAEATDPGRDSESSPAIQEEPALDVNPISVNDTTPQNVPDESVSSGSDSEDIQEPSEPVHEEPAEVVVVPEETEQSTKPAEDRPENKESGNDPDAHVHHFVNNGDYEADHPHKCYEVCTGCRATRYTGQNKSTYDRVELSRSGYVNQSLDMQSVAVTYGMKCRYCGDVKDKQTVTINEQHNYADKGHIEKEHHDGQGHKTFDRCACGAVNYTGYAKLLSCSSCKINEENQKQASSHTHEAKSITITSEQIIEIALNHPDHSYSTVCSICGEPMTIRMKCSECNCKYSAKHTHVVSPKDKNLTTVGTCKHNSSLKCCICGETFGTGWSATCIQCNPNEYDYSKEKKALNSAKSEVTYSQIRETDEFRDQYLYAPNGGEWVADERYTADGASPMLLHPNETMVHLATYFTPEETKILNKYMKDRSDEVLLGNISDWLLGILGKELNDLNVLTDTGSKMYDGTKLFFEVADCAEEHGNEKISITEKDLRELEERNIGFGDVKEAYIVSDMAQLLGAHPAVGAVTVVWQMFSTADYLTSTWELENAVDHNKGVIIENSFRYDSLYGMGLNYRLERSEVFAGNIRTWNNYPYMENNYVLYGTYSADE